MTVFRQFALLLVPAWLVAAALLSFMIVEHGISRAESLLAESELRLVNESAKSLEHRFGEIPRAHADAEAAFVYWHERLDDAEVERGFSESFVRKADGTWRSRDVLFDGAADSPIGPVKGIGAFVAPGPLDRAARRELVSILRAIATVAPGQRHFLESLWFVTPRGDLVIFAPDRTDKLGYYRRQAPPETDFKATPFVRAAMPAQNPERKTLCTGLNRAVYDSSGETLITSCQTPTSDLERAAGVWGTSLLMNNRLGQIVSTEAPDRISVLAARDGTLVAAPGFSVEEGVLPEAVASLAAKLQWSTIQRTLLNGSESGVVDDPSLPWLAVYRRIQGPDMFLVHLRDRSAIFTELGADLPFVVAVALLLLVAQVALCLVAIRLQISRPLQQLAQSYAGRDALDPQANVPIKGAVEIRALQTQLDRAWREAADLVNDLEVRVAQRTGELALALEAEGRANIAKDNFLANASHEIRTPLNGMVALADALLNSHLDERQREMIQAVRAGGEALTLITSDILDAAKLEAGKINLVETPFVLTSLIVEVTKGPKLLAAQKGVAFCVEIKHVPQDSLVGDALRLKQVIQNLVLNAVKFTDHGEVRVIINSEAASDELAWVDIVVEDTGIGFDAAISERLFERFEQADSSIARRAGGTGLGLTISRALAELMGGSLTATSSPGAGSRFMLRLPFKNPEPGTIDLAGRDADPGEAPAPPLGLRVLVVEDHPRNRQVMSLLLEELGATPVCVEGGLEGVSAFKSQRFDIVLMDMQMPEVDGLAATRLVRAHEIEAERGRTPVIMVSASSTQHHVAQATEAGCDGFLTKPITVQDLCRALARAGGTPRGLS